MFIVDSHCHLDALDYEKLHKNVDDVLTKAKQRDVQYCLAIGVGIERFQQLHQMLAHRNDVSFSCGLHPLDIGEEIFDLAKFQQILALPEVVAVGEIGLDYYYSAENKTEQQQCFAQQIDLANQFNKPVIIHTRCAGDDTIRLLKQHQADRCGGVIHCFTENQWFADQALDLGFYISVSGIITFKNAEDIREVIRHVPLDRLLVETDSPYLAPVPYRGKQNQPAYVREVCEYVAALKGVSVETLAEITTANFCQLFGVNLSQ